MRKLFLIVFALLTIVSAHSFAENSPATPTDLECTHIHYYNQGTSLDLDNARYQEITNDDFSHRMFVAATDHLYCSDCNQLINSPTYTKEIVEPHTYQNGVCTYCGHNCRTCEDENESHAFIFRNNTREASIGDTVSVSYVRLRDDIRIIDFAWVGEGFSLFISPPTETSGTISIIANQEGQYWFEIVYCDSEGNYYLDKSEPIIVSGYEIRVTLTGVNDNNEIEAGETLGLEYDITGGKDGFILKMCWIMDINDAFYYTETTSESRMGSVTLKPQGEVKSIGYTIQVKLGGWTAASVTLDGWISVLNYIEDYDHSYDLELISSTSEVYAGDTVSVTYAKKRDDINIVYASWMEFQGKASNGMRIDLPNELSGTIYQTVGAGEQCCLEIIYCDDEGNYYAARSTPINIISYEIRVTLTGMNDNNEIEMGDLLKLEYEIVGGKDDFTLNMHWILDLGGMTTINTETISSTDRTGSITLNTQGDIKAIRYYIGISNHSGTVAYRFAGENDLIRVINIHSWNEPVYEWTSNNSYVKATRVCNNNPNHIETETSEAVKEILQTPSQNDPGYAYYSASFENDAFTMQKKTIEVPPLSSMDVIYLPDSVTTIETEAFINMAADAVIVPAHCTMIAGGAFANCRNLKYVKIPAGVEIPDNAFSGCTDVVIDQN